MKVAFLQVCVFRPEPLPFMSQCFASSGSIKSENIQNNMLLN